MPAMQYRTRGNTGPQGKPKVYFCCHPKDFALCFEEIVEDILKYQNCSVWYVDWDAEDKAPDWEEHFADLGRMQLFVMPVTTRLLTTPCYALDREFPFAVAQHIPVLPLMQERGLEEMFNERCGELHFLDKNHRDDTAIGYEEKLEKYLASVLIGDELMEKIRAAFDAYVFLSYRKKDRRYAQELMHLIHKNDFCRDIAIWYDEFLTPGENFNDSIREALLKSGLFVMAVTPNLVNENNYIMTTEYPMAVQEGKPVLPARLLPTDREALAQKYKGIPACTDAHDDAAFSEALLEALKTLAIREKDSTPEHIFFIGLAYLGGVDVEVNHGRAVELITSAAEAGLMEAVEKLVEMYRNGLGVTRSYETGIFWQEKKIAMAEAAYRAEPAEDSLSALFRALCECGDYYHELERLSEAREKYETAQRYIGESPLTESSSALRMSLFANYHMLGGILYDEGNLAGAEECCGKAHEIAKKLAGESAAVGAQRALSVSYSSLGRLLEAKGELAAAKEYYERAFAVDEKLAEETGAAEDLNSLAVSCERLGGLLVEEGNPAKAREFYEKRHVIAQRLAAETGAAESKRSLLVSYEKLGGILREEDNLAGAGECYEKALFIAQELVQKTGTIQALRDLSVIWDRLGGILEERGEPAAAREYFEKSLAVAQELVQKTGTVRALRDLSVSCNKLGGILEMEENLAAAGASYEKGLEIREKLAEKLGTAEAWWDVTVSCERLGDVLMAEGEHAKAKGYFEKSLGIAEELAQKTGTAKAMQAVVVYCLRLDDILEAEGHSVSAREYCEKACKFSERLVRESGEVPALQLLAVSLESLGGLLEAEGDAAEAKACFEKARKIRQRLAAEEEEL